MKFFWGFVAGFVAAFVLLQQVSVVVVYDARTETSNNYTSYDTQLDSYDFGPSDFYSDTEISE